jgi:HD-like signal output (HDOD) protein
MKNWIARLLGGAGEPARARANAPASAPGTADAAAPRAALVADPGDDAAMAFWHWLCAGIPAAGGALAAGSPAARLLLDELARLARAPGDAADLVPRVPEVIPRLLRSLREEGVSSADLARQVTQDAVLVAEVIREANSPFYRPAKPVRTVDAAILVLGQNGLRMLLARVAFRPVMSAASGRVARLVAPRLWLHAERCARAAALLAPGMKADPFEGYLAGLVIDVGLMVAFRLLDRLPGHALDDPALAAALSASARQLSARIALHWALPPPIAAAILQADTLQAGAPDGDESAPLPALARVLAEADRLARLRLLLDAGVLAPDAPALAALDGPAARIVERLAAEPA